MKKITNFRLLFFCAVALAIGIFVGSFVYTSFLLSILLPIALVAVGILLSCGTKKHSFWILFSVFALGIALFIIDVALNTPHDITSEVQVEGRVCEVNETSGTVLLENVTMDGVSIKGYFYGKCEGVETGDILRFYATPQVCRFEKESFSKYLFARNVSYRADIDEYTVEKGSLTLSESIRTRCKKAILPYAGEEETGVLLCLLFGDKSLLEGSVYQNASSAGISHIFAVSGLHVGFLIALLYWVFRKIRLNRYVSFGLILVFLVAYGFLTGFPAGMVRASVFFVLFSAAKIFGRKGDGLTCLGCSAFVILLCSPRQIFSIGFLMSFGAVGGILLYNRSLTAILSERIKVPVFRYFWNLVCVTVSANVFLLPLTISIFGSVSPYSVLSNLVVIPYIGILFPLLAVSAFLATCYSGFGILYVALKYPIFALNAFTKLMASLPYATVSVQSMGVASVGYILFFLCVSKLNLTRPAVKYSVSALLGIGTVLCLIFV